MPNRMTMNRTYLLTLAFLGLFACGQEQDIELSEEDHLEEINEWHQGQMDFLRSDEGWLNLIGLHWLEEGVNTFGSDGVDIKIHEGQFPNEIGTFFLENSSVYFSPSVDGVLLEGEELKERALVFDLMEGIDGHMKYKSLYWNIIKRGDSFGIRLRDLNAQEVQEFDGVERYPVDMKWRVKANFVPYDPIKEVMITNVVGQVSPNASAGYVEFEIEGKKYQIDALANPDDIELFLMFADNTSGDETYGGGRYMYVDRDFSNNEIILDFNKAYNPPCVYTAYATCPLPPRQNVLDLAITAGQKNYGKH